jgi:hypothetical protein
MTVPKARLSWSSGKDAASALDRRRPPGEVMERDGFVFVDLVSA